MAAGTLKMDSRTVLLAILFLLGMGMLVHAQNDTMQHDAAGGPMKLTRRIKRMYVMCPPNFKRIGNECYYISPNKLNWLDAYFECKDANSKLAEPMKYEDKHIRKYLLKNKQTEDLWIGGTFNWKAHKWQWGHNGRDIEYQSFSQMVPGRDLKYTCALLRSDLQFRWSAEECTKKLNFICQHRMPLVPESGRYALYDKWNKTYPYQKANEKLVYIVNEPNNRNRSETGRPRIYNSVKRVLQYNPSIRPRPAHRRQNRPRKIPTSPRPIYIPPAVVVPKQQFAQYAPDTPNDINTIDNGGHRNGYTSMAQFNIDIGPQSSKNRDVSFQRGHRLGHGVRGNGEARQPHQHRHQPGLHRTTKRTHHVMPAYPQYVVRSSTMPPYIPPPTTTITSTSTTTTTTPAPPSMPPTATMRPPFFPPTSTVDLKYSNSLVLTEMEKKAKRDRLRERLKKLTPEEQRLFFQDREKRKRMKLQQLQQHQRDNEVVQ
uniref:C-type lectin domain-containing protein n=1 Tax=Anopheles farauti TaxID=69004 RepID=A0A182QL52_9DIPT